jgi:hypothetical protein
MKLCPVKSKNENTLMKTELFGNFSCPMDFRKSWEPLFKQMTKTITLL